MKLNVYAVYDQAIKAYKTPFFAESDAEAKRMFAGACQRDDVTLRYYPDDFRLDRVGEFDRDSGVLVWDKSLPERIATAREFVPEDVPPQS